MSLLPFGSAPTPIFVGDNGSGGKKGSVPAPPAGSAAANKFLSAGGTWAVVPVTDNVKAAKVVSLSSGIQTISISYTSAIPTAGVPIITFINLVDPTPIFLQAIITAYSTTGFTAIFNAPTDTANYSMSYITSGVV